MFRGVKRGLRVAGAARLVALVDKVAALTVPFLLVGGGDAVYARAVWLMESQAFGIQHVIVRLPIFGNCGFGCAFVEPAFAGCVVDIYARLIVVAVHIKAYACAVVFNRFGFHLDTAGNQVVSVKNWGYAV